MVLVFLGGLHLCSGVSGIRAGFAPLATTTRHNQLQTWRACHQRLVSNRASCSTPELKFGWRELRTCLVCCFMAKGDEIGHCVEALVLGSSAHQLKALRPKPLHILWTKHACRQSVPAGIRTRIQTLWKSPRESFSSSKLTRLCVSLHPKSL